MLPTIPLNSVPPPHHENTSFFGGSSFKHNARRWFRPELKAAAKFCLESIRHKPIGHRVV